MSLESTLETLIKAVEANTLALGKLLTGAAPAPAPKAEKKDTKAPEPKADDKPQPTIADVRAAAQKVLDAGGPKHIRPLLTKYGVEKISAAPAEKYAEVIADLAEALKKTEADKAEGALV